MPGTLFAGRFQASGRSGNGQHATMKIPCQMLPDTIVFFGFGVEDVEKRWLYRRRRPEDVVLLVFFSRNRESEERINYISFNRVHVFYEKPKQNDVFWTSSTINKHMAP